MNEHRQAVIDILDAYLQGQWKKPIKWLMDVSVEDSLCTLPVSDMFSPQMDRNHNITLAGIPVERGHFSFGIAAVVEDYRMCRVGDFVKHGSMPEVSDTHDYINFQPMPQRSMAESVELHPAWRFEKQKFLDGYRLFYLWRRVE